MTADSGQGNVATENTKTGDIKHVTQSAIAVGAHSRAVVTINAPSLGDADNAELTRLLEDLRGQIAASAPPELREEALKRTAEIAEALDEEEPDLPRLESVRNWFVRKLPSLAGAVVSLIVHPLVGKLVEAAGDALTADFRRRFGGDASY